MQKLLGLLGLVFAVSVTVSATASSTTSVAADAKTAPDRCPPPSLSRADLDALRQNGFEVPSAEERNRIALLLPACLGDSDPALRDGIAFEALSKWMRAGALEGDTIRTLAARLMPLLLAPDDAAGFRKPFAALVLSEVARADRIAAVLPDAMRGELVDEAAQYLRGITDHRGFDPKEGWRHGAAHGADLVLQLGLNEKVSADEVRRLLGAMATQIAPPGTTSYIFGEPERFARAAYFIHRRGVLSDAFWDEWLAAIGDPKPLRNWSAAYETVEGLARRHNTMAFLHALSFAGRSGGDEPGAKLAALADREITRIMRG
jgi:Protein of unknown function (DUF2785)